MEKEQFEKLEKNLNEIYRNIPSEVSLFSVENSLDELNKNIEKQNNILERIEDLLYNIENNLPSSNNVNIDHVETLLDRICDKINTTNSRIDDIYSNM